MRFYLTFVRVAIIIHLQNLQITNVGKDVGKGNSCTLLVGM